MRYNTELKKGNIVNIYLDCKADKEHEGVAVLEEFIYQQDSFIMEDENVMSNPERDSEPNLTKEVYNTLLYNLINNNEFEKRKTKDFVNKIKKAKSKSLSEFNDIKDILMEEHSIQFENHNPSREMMINNPIKKMFSLIPINYITRYFQQYNFNKNKLGEYKPSIFTIELWKVTMIYNANGEEENRTVVRKIKKIIKNKCDNNKISEYITYNGEKLTIGNARKQML